MQADLVGVEVVHLAQLGIPAETICAGVLHCALEVECLPVAGFQCVVGWLLGIVLVFLAACASLALANSYGFLMFLAAARLGWCPARTARIFRHLRPGAPAVHSCTARKRRCSCARHGFTAAAAFRPRRSAWCQSCRSWRCACPVRRTGS